MPNVIDIKHHFEKLTGKKVTKENLDLNIFEGGQPLGYSQFNEVLLFLELNRVNKGFFQYLVNGETEYELHSSIKDEKHLENAVKEFRKVALLWFGNVKYGFKKMSTDEDSLIEVYYEMLPLDEDTIYKSRHEPIKKNKRIPKDKTFLLGYISQQIIDKEYEKNPTDGKVIKLKEEKDKYMEWGIENQDIYLTYDHLDVYIATSMRGVHDFINVDENIEKIFNSVSLKNLKLRYFNPVQAYCKDRIEKGLSEALMLKRAKCTIYFVQEMDTLGKDSELASTLAQGKPVIAFVPHANKQYVDNYLKTIFDLSPNKTKNEILLEQLKIFSPNLPWEKESEILRGWIQNPDSANTSELLELLYEKAKAHYDKRASTLMSKHPLGIQVDLETGVANGVLVVREIEDCAKLLRNIMLNELEFDLEPISESNGLENLHLIERISKSIFRLQTGDHLLTRSFWNFYQNQDI
jgi:hypothetical protein